MQFPDSYIIDNKIKSLSSRLNYIAKDSNSSRFYVNTEIKSENLKYNYSYLLSQIILELEFVKRGKKEFLYIISQYNSENGTNLSFEDFTSINWITEIGDEVIIPEMLRHFVWKIGYDEENGKSVIIPNNYLHKINSLKLYYETYFKDTNLIIKKEILERILEVYASKEITIESLVKKGLMIPNKTSNSYLWGYYSEHIRHLSDEIATTLWEELGGENATSDDFEKFYRLIRGAGIWPSYTVNYVPLKSRRRLTDLAAEYLYTLDDLKQSNSEFRKMWLNARDRYNRAIESEIPTIQFNYDDQYKFIESIKDVAWQFHDIFDYQQSRNYCLLLLRIIIENEPTNPKPFQTLLKILSTMDMPIVLWNSYEEIPRQYPQVIPYLLTDVNLIPLAFQLIDRIQINESAVPEQQDRDTKHKVTKEEINTIWNEMFDIILERIGVTNFEIKKISTSLTRILADLAEKVFNTNGNTSMNVTDHNIFKKRYDNAIKILGNKRASNFQMQSGNITPRIIFHYLPEMANYIIDQLKNKKSYRYHYLKINSGLFDLGIEILRLINLRTSEAEISKETISELKNISNRLTESLKESLDVFYTTTEITVPTYGIEQVEVRAASRTAEEFGFEIIDWGYLFLHFERMNLLDDINNTAIDSVDFLTSGSNYDEQNIEQATKLKLFIKSLLLAFLTINERKSQYEIDVLPVNSVLNKLENWIKKYALIYSNDNILNSQIDIFNDRYKSFGYDLYYQHLADLLYKSISHFNLLDQEKFVQEYFSTNTDISRMLTAINMIESKLLREIVSKRISEVDIQDYIDQRVMATDLEYALLEAVNSENHWHLSEPLITRLKQHFDRVGKVDINTENFFFEINLLLAFKQKDFAKLISFEVPKKQYAIHGTNIYGERKKRFFIALFKLYNDKDYKNAIILFKALLSEDQKNIRYAYHIYRAQTLKALSE